MAVAAQIYTTDSHGARERTLEALLTENPRLNAILTQSETPQEACRRVREWIEPLLRERVPAASVYARDEHSVSSFLQLGFRDYALIRILDYLDHSGESFPHPAGESQSVLSDPFGILFAAVRGRIRDATIDFYIDMRELFRQLHTERREPVTREQQLRWMERHPSGLQDDIRKIRRQNRNRIVDVIITLIDSGEKRDSRYFFSQKLSLGEKRRRVRQWWREHLFHFRFAARDPKTLNRMLGNTLSDETLRILENARTLGLPILVNPHYLSLLNVNPSPGMSFADQAIRDYVLYSKELVDAFGRIVAWEKEDIIAPGEPNAAGWILPLEGHIHRRYPDSAVLIPNPQSACGGICSTCQRMYSLQTSPSSVADNPIATRLPWKQRLPRVLDYFREDPQIRDILITGGDVFMATDQRLAYLLREVVEMAVRKRDDNCEREEGQKYQEIIRVRMGTRLPVYLPQRFTPGLMRILARFVKQASAAGIRQLILQTHFESAMELVPESLRAIRRLQRVGFRVVNQHVLTTASSRRGHVGRLRQELLDIDVLPYYTFSVKGFFENHHLYATCARLVQEMVEEKIHGRDPDRSIVNLPGVGKSLTFRVIGITSAGERILAFDPDPTRPHSPVIEHMGRFCFVETKSVSAYLRQIAEMGEEPGEYATLFGYSMARTESVASEFAYPPATSGATRRHVHLKI